MRYRQYQFKFYLNASHSILINGNYGAGHPHTWEISLHVLKYRDQFVQFSRLEKRMEEFLEPYQNNMLNDVEPFDRINPTLENICEYFKDQCRDWLNQEGWLLLKLEMSETPTRSYIINLLDETENETRGQSIETVADYILDQIIKEKRENKDE